MEYTIDEIKAIVRELFNWDGQIEDLISNSEVEGQTEYQFDANTAIAKLKAFAEVGDSTVILCCVR